MKNNDKMFTAVRVIIVMILPILYAILFIVSCLSLFAHDCFLSVPGMILFALLFVDNILFSKYFMEYIKDKYFC